eukprot:10627-Pelagococcus_subviridis.AAC.1
MPRELRERLLVIVAVHPPREDEPDGNALRDALRERAAVRVAERDALGEVAAHERLEFFKRAAISVRENARYVRVRARPRPLVRVPSRLEPLHGLVRDERLERLARGEALRLRWRSAQDEDALVERVGALLARGVRVEERAAGREDAAAAAAAGAARRGRARVRVRRRRSRARGHLRPVGRGAAVCDPPWCAEKKTWHSGTCLRCPTQNNACRIIGSDKLRLS